MIRRKELTLDMVCDPAWLLWFKRHGFDPNEVLVRGWDNQGKPLTGWAECDDDARRVTALVMNGRGIGRALCLQLESPAMAFPS